MRAKLRPGDAATASKRLGLYAYKHPARLNPKYLSKALIPFIEVANDRAYDAVRCFVSPDLFRVGTEVMPNHYSAGSKERQRLVRIARYDISGVAAINQHAVEKAFAKRRRVEFPTVRKESDE